MISFFVGPNAYYSQHAIAELERQFHNTAIVRKDGGELTIAQLPDLLQGMSLFASERLVVLKEVSSNKAVWEALAGHLQNVSSEIHLVLVESAPDKRTKTFKMLQKNASIVECAQLNETQAVEWLKQEAVKRGGEISSPAARLLVEFIGVDEWRLGYELEKLLLVGDTSPERIKSTIEPTPQASAFALLDAALGGREKEMRELLRQCQATEDPFRLFGLLVNQVYQLAVVSAAERKTADEIAKDIGAHPYPIKKLQNIARKLTHSQVTVIVDAIAQLDDQMKRTVADPWLLIEQALMKVTTK